MIRNNVFLYLPAILAVFIAGSVGREAIIGGTQVTDQKPYRYMVSLLQVDHGHLCGGVLIGEQSVLTAAHCFVYPNNTFKSAQVFALMGTKNLLDFDYPTINIEVVKVYVPIEFDPSEVNSIADIAVLKLKESLRLINHRTTKLVSLPRNRYVHYNGQKAVISGWGWNRIDIQDNQFAGRRTDPILQFAVADILTNQQCQREQRTIAIDDVHVCARLEQYEHEIRGVCRGDDGGPLVHDGMLIGVLSFYPKNCSESTRPAVYTRVAHYLTFIRNAKMDRVTRTMRAHVLHR